MYPRLRTLFGLSLLSLQSACAMPPASAVSPTPFLLEGWKLQYAIGCAGEREARSPGGGVMHELYACAGSYSDAQCTTLRAIPDELILARCTYTITAGHRARRVVRFLRCDVPSEDMRSCGADDVLWSDAGPRPPKS